ncbi:MAG: hypothetical protein NT169_27815 [Chloroflexi bacterium]|nr:hypothetical protein [Chloroflexota bacterium]
MATLTVFCPLGLSNRLRVLLSGLALAEASGREFKMLWPITPTCAAPFTDLFANPWPVQTVDASAVADLPYVSGWFGHLPDLLIVHDPHVVVGHPGWLIRPEQFPGHEPLLACCQALFAELEPMAPIQHAVEEFRQRHFRPTMIGVHLRRGDLLRQRPDAAHNTAQAVAAVDHFLKEYPDAGILLCTDDDAVDPNTGRHARKEGIQETFRLRYGSRVIWTTPRSLDRRTPEAIQDALVDLWLLRATDCFVGTKASSFSELVVFARDSPHLLVAGATPGYRRIERLGRMIGLHAALTALGKQQTGRELPFPALMRHYAGAPYHWMRQTLRRLFPTPVAKG